jgi:hypothetical protein
MVRFIHLFCYLLIERHYFIRNNKHFDFVKGMEMMIIDEGFKFGREFKIVVHSYKV